MNAVTLIFISWAIVAGTVCTYIGEHIYINTMTRITLNTLVIVVCAMAAVFCISYLMNPVTNVPLDNTIYI